MTDKTPLENGKYVLALFSNISLLNCTFLGNVNSTEDNDLKEGNIGDWFDIKWNQFIHNLIIKKINKAKKGGEGTSEFIFEDFKDINKSFGNYLRNLRNYYSHSTNTGNYKNAEKYVNENEDEIISLFRKIFANTRFYLIFNKIKNEEFRILFLQMFWTNSEFEEFKNAMFPKNKENNPFSNIRSYFIEKKYIRDFRFKISLIKNAKLDIELKIVNYINNFGLSKNKKNSFIRISKNLLNWYFNDKGVKFSPLISSKQQKQNNYCLSIDHKNLPEKDKNVLLNFEEIRKLLIGSTISDDIKNNFLANISNTKKDSKYKNNDEKIYKDIHFKDIFKKQFSNEGLEKLDNKHLIKMFNKVLIRVCDKEKDLGEKRFHILMHSLNTKNDSLIEHDRELVNLLAKLEIDKGNLKLDINKFIINKVKDFETFKNMFKKNTEENSGDNKVKEKVVNNIIYHVKPIPKDFDYGGLYNFKAKKDKESNDIKKFIMPILLFFNEHISQKGKGKYFLVPENLFNKDIKNTILKDKLWDVFKDSIFANKNEVIIADSDISHKKDYSLKMDCTTEYFKSHRDKIYSKLFFEIAKLKGIQNDYKINDGDIKSIIETMDEYKKNEMSLIKKCIDKEEKDKEKNEYRNFIFHRSLSKFKTEKNFKEKTEKLLEVNPYNGKKKTKTYNAPIANSKYEDLNNELSDNVNSLLENDD